MRYRYTPGRAMSFYHAPVKKSMECVIVAKERDCYITWETLSNFEEVVSDIRKECYAIHVLWYEKLQPRCSEVRFSGDLDDLIWCHLDLLDQAVGDLLTCFKCIDGNRPFGPQDGDSL